MFGSLFYFIFPFVSNLYGRINTQYSFHGGRMKTIEDISTLEKKMMPVMLTIKAP